MTYRYRKDKFAYRTTKDYAGFAYRTTKDYAGTVRFLRRVGLSGYLTIQRCRLSDIVEDGFADRLPPGRRLPQYWEVHDPVRGAAYHRTFADALADVHERLWHLNWEVQS